MGSHSYGPVYSPKPDIAIAEATGGFARDFRTFQMTPARSRLYITWIPPTVLDAKCLMRQPKPLGLADRRQSAPDDHRRAVRNALIEIDNILVD
ncbi:hypothetical protein GCM10007937_25220 [Mesorhizobium albiziae]|nr:hypothetical protein GCM10007937_25220 [Mesorhizobium albiziae]